MSLSQIFKFLQLYSQELTSIFCIVIIAAALWFFWDFKQVTKKIAEELENVTDQLQNNLCIDDINWKEFSYLESSWNAFRQRVYCVSNSSDVLEEGADRVIWRSECSPSEYFNIYALTEKKINMRWQDAMPSVLTGMGILFTFIGLAIGIGAVYGTATDQTNVAEITESIQSLLGGASMAFWTSIVGLFLSLLYQWLKKIYLFELNKKIDSFVNKIEQLVEVQTDSAMHRETLQMMEEQTMVMNKISESWQLEMKKFLETLIENQNTNTEKMTASVTGMSKDQVNAINRLVDSAVGNFTKQLGDKMGEMNDSFSDTAKAVSQSVDSLDNVLNRMSAIVNATSETITSGIERIGVTIHSIEEDFEKGKEHSLEITEALKNSAETFNKEIKPVSDHFALTIEKFDGVVTHQETMLTGYDAASNKTVDTMTKALENVGQVVLSMEKSFESQKEKFGEIATTCSTRTQEYMSTLKDGAQQFTDSVSETTGALTKVVNDFSEIFNHQNTLFEGWEKTNTDLLENITGGVTSISSATENIKNYLNQSSEKALEISETMSKTGDELAQKIKEAVAPLEGITREQQKLLVGYGETTQSFIDGAVEFRGVFEEFESLQASLSELLSVLDTNQTKSNKALRALITGVLDEMKAMTGDLGKASKQTSNDVKGYATDLNKIITDNLSMLAEGLKSLHEHMQKNLSTTDNQMSRALDSLKQAVDHFEKSFKVVQNDMSGNIKAFNGDIKLLRETVSSLQSAQTKKVERVEVEDVSKDKKN